MAKQLLTKYAYDPEGFYFVNSYSQLLLATETGKSAQWIDNNTGSYLIVKGRGFDNDGFKLIEGKITSAAFYDADDKLISKITDFSYNASDFDGLDAYQLLYDLLGKRDTITGSDGKDIMFGYGGPDVMVGGKGNDFLYGQEGADRMSGGKGADDFRFQSGDKGDVITDFQSEGPNKGHDQLYVMADSYDVIKAGDDTLLKFDSGTTVRLLDFKPRELDIADVVLLADPF